MSHRWWLALVLIGLPAFAGVTLVKSGRPIAAIVIPADATRIERHAAEELRDHLEMASGARLPIVDQAPAGARVLIGRAAAAAGVAAQGLELEQYRIRTAGDALCLTGRDRGDDPLDLGAVQPGTLFAVYDLLDRELGVRWLWPGEFGTCVPRRTSISITDLDRTGGPRLVQRKMRTLRTRLRDMQEFATDGIDWLPAATTARLARDEYVWLRRQQMGRRENLPFGHSFTKWWDQYGQSHPDYFAKLPNRSQPYPRPDRVKLCVSNPAVVEQIIKDWQAAGAPPALAACPNDSRAYCTCERCREWDKPELTTPDNVDKSVLTYRYVRFWNAIAEKASRINPDVLVCGYAYTNYRIPPKELKLRENIALGYIGNPSSVPRRPDGDDLFAHWAGWAEAGARLFFRPNWFCSGHMTPYLPLRDSGGFFKYAYDHKLLGTDFDSLFGRWSTQGAWYYVVARLHARPDLAVEQVIAEYTSAFGKAAPAVARYLDFWEKFTAARTAEEAPGMYAIVAAMPKLFTANVLASAERILDEAARLARPDDAQIRGRVQFLQAGLTHLRLTTEAIAAVSAARSAGVIEDVPDLLGVIRRLRVYRREIAPRHHDWTEWTDQWEIRMGDHSGFEMTSGLDSRTPAAALPLRWRFKFDPDQRGDAERWFEQPGADWPEVSVAEPWRLQPVVQKTKPARTVWYTVAFRAPASRAALLLPGVGGPSRVWLNGKELGARSARAFELQDLAFSSGTNRLTLRVEPEPGRAGVFRPVWVLK